MAVPGANSLFAFLQHNAKGSAAFFGVPARQVVEFGTEIRDLTRYAEAYDRTTDHTSDSGRGWLCVVGPACLGNLASKAWDGSESRYDRYNFRSRLSAMLREQPSCGASRRWPTLVLAGTLALFRDGEGFACICIRRSALLQPLPTPATIGGLADWYAVVALFRRPLGLPVLHTRDHPEQISTALPTSSASFIEVHFLDATPV